MDLKQVAQEIRSRAGKQILQKAQPRYFIDGDEECLSALLSLAPAEVVGEAIRLGRSEKSHWRTVLLSEASFSDEAVHKMYRWAAEVRERLPGTESADLYMVMLVKGIPNEEAVKIETDDNFCRKYVARSTESIGDLLDRTFLGPVIAQDAEGTPQDPVSSAVKSTMVEHPWTRPLLESWNRVLVNGTPKDAFKFMLESVSKSNRND